MKIKTLNYFIIVDEIKETKTISKNIDIVNSIDDANRYVKGKVLSASENTPLKEGDVIYYNKTNGFNIDENGVLHRVIQLNDVVGVIEE